VDKAIIIFDAAMGIIFLVLIVYVLIHQLKQKDKERFEQRSN